MRIFLNVTIKKCSYAKCSINCNYNCANIVAENAYCRDKTDKDHGNFLKLHVP